jgi:hypothetical protein
LAGLKNGWNCAHLSDGPFDNLRKKTRFRAF